MNVKPIPNELLGDNIILLMPAKKGFSETPIKNVRVERAEETENGSLCRTGITVWADYHNSTWTEFPIGARVKFGSELFEITEQKIYRATEPHHCKFKAVKIGDDNI